MHLIRIALAVTAPEKMQQFYNQVFQANLKAVETPSGTFYQGQLGNLALTLVPNSVAQIKAEQNRHQLSFWVDNLDASLRKVEAAGGKVMNEMIEGAEGKLVAISDPDGNTLELMQTR